MKSSRCTAVLNLNDKLLQPEQNLRLEGFHLIAGVDEAGRGPLAGPVVAAAVILPILDSIPAVNDSKQLSDADRRVLRDRLLELDGIVYAISVVDADVVDKINILQATHQAMRQAVSQLEKQPDIVIVDGNPVRGFAVEARNLIKGDAKSASIAAASIIAKVERDKYMDELDNNYPEYGFKKHKGYVTKAHQQAIKEHGVCINHRKSFAPVKEVLLQNPIIKK